MNSTGEPLVCGWCVSKCAYFDECPPIQNFIVQGCPIILKKASGTLQCCQSDPACVNYVSPTKGPSSGGTLLTLEGDNFGSPAHKPDSSIQITVGNKPCALVHWNYTFVQCKTPAGKSDTLVDIVVNVNDTYWDTEKSFDILDKKVAATGFQYQISTFSGITPSYGPRAGGTSIALHGANLDSGASQTVSVGSHPCHIHSVTNVTILCSTSRLEGSHPGGDETHRVTLMIDGQEVPYLPTKGLTATFSYKPNPVVNKILPASATFKGRSKVLVLGENLDSVVKPVMVTRVTSLNNRHHENISKVCVPADDGHSLGCPVASLFDSSVIPRDVLQNHKDPIWVQVHFQMDGLRLPERAPGMEFVYKPPPKFYLFPPGGLDVRADDPTVLIRHRDAFELPEETFRRQYRLAKNVVRWLCDELREEPELRRLRGSWTVMTVEQQVLCALRFYATGSFQGMVASDEHIARDQATVSIVVRAVSLAIVQIPGVIGCVDGTMIAIVGPSQNDPTVTKAAYWCRKQYYALDVVVVCDADCQVMSIDPRYPGSVHDSFAWRYSWLRSNFEQGRLIDDGRFLLGDSGYALEPWLITPVPGFHATSTASGRFNKAHSSMRSVVERCIGLLKSRFRCLQRHRTLYYHPTTATVIISACAVLPNICLSWREPEPEPDSDPDEPGLESGLSSDGSESSSEGSVADDERLAPAHPRISLSGRGRALRQRLVAHPTQATVAVSATRDTTSAKESVATTEVPLIRDTVGDREPLIVLATVALPHTRDATGDSKPSLSSPRLTLSPPEKPSPWQH
ncbi:hypothetical protein HPB47_018710, partial [Ixodes persulcatus]